MDNTCPDLYSAGMTKSSIQTGSNKLSIHAYKARLPNTQMLNRWLIIKNNSSRMGIKKSGNVMQQTMHSYVCGINLRSESSVVL